MRPLVATYRLQLGPDLTLARAATLVPYLRDLGVSHLYLSPVMRARPGSTHGYDVVDPRVVSPELGGEDALRALAAQGLELIVDIVPNHMATCDENEFWRDERLRATFFDLDPEGGHRRFFDVDELAGVRVEDPEVFAVTHGKIVELVRDGVVAGVRVDHVDGLADPGEYLQRLGAAGVEHVWVEKILETGEQLPPWPVEGTTGYEFLVDADALFVDRDARDALDAVAGDREPFHVVADRAKAEQVARTFGPEVARLRRVADLPGLDDALVAMPVYRTYVDPVSRRRSRQDDAAIDRLPRPVADALRGRVDVPSELVVRFQQTTGAVMAKGVEDTALYRDVRLLALNEVGGDPDRFGIPVEQFHAANETRAARWPRALLAATTHDTKRSADVRARIAALSAMPDAWAELVGAWERACARHAAHRSDAGPEAGPDAGERLFALQTLVGAWPLSRERLEGYLVKALREAKQRTSWIDPDVEHEAAVVDVVHRAGSDAELLDRFLPFLERVVDVADRIALGELVLRCTVPGVPDLYQGDELWNHLLVDPDNRRPVDWDLRTTLLAELRVEVERNLVHRTTAKLFATRALFEVRARLGDPTTLPYRPVDLSPDVCSFLRGDRVAVSVPLRADLPHLGPAALGLGGADRWTDVLGPLDAVYGDRRPAVFVDLD